jgi:hypothetical protein
VINKHDSLLVIIAQALAVARLLAFSRVSEASIVRSSVVLRIPAPAAAELEITIAQLYRPTNNTT